jgi:hypothetical protein
MPYIKRKPELWYVLNLWGIDSLLFTFNRTSYLSVSAPFHSQRLLSDAPAAILADLVQSGNGTITEEQWQNWVLKFPVYSTLDGSDLSKKSGVLTDLLALQCNQPLHWAVAIKSALPANSITHVSTSTYGKTHISCVTAL